MSPRILERWKLALALGGLTAALGSCGAGTAGAVDAREPSNVLLVVADDVGVDMLAAYGVHPNAPPTPNLDALIADGVLFERAYTPPTCSPTRSAILTGRLSFRTGLGQPIDEWLPEFALQLDERTLPEVLKAGSATPIATSAIGKWHLGSVAVGDVDHPNLQGFDWFEGPFGNLFLNQDYFDYAKILNGVRVQSQVYATTDQVDDAIARVQAMPEPWFLYVGFSAAHTPLHAPPQNLHTYTLSGDPDASRFEHYCAMVQAMDTELGRLLAAIPPDVRARTTVVFIGDNGSPNQVVTPPSIPSQSKGSLYEGGVRVPLLIAGRDAVAKGARCSALVQSVDLFPTVIELMEADLEQGVGDNRPIDGRSITRYLSQPLAPSQRTFAVAEKFEPNGFGPYTSTGAMVRDARWKLIRRSGLPDALFDLQGLDREGVDLNDGSLTAEESAALARLQVWLDQTIDMP
ncbi:MAG: sulfatase-like hydrolase/transferase [Planctomycetota bacterium]|nr:sulfatase-like hydrolase/transferase [Planctomycetota bacterium]